MLPASIVVNTAPGVVAYNAIQLAGIAGIYRAEIDSPMPYSKFASSSAASSSAASSSEKKTATVMVPSRTGMLTIYVPATIVAFVFQLVLPQAIGFAPSVAGWLVLAHFLKRDAEVLFLHRYSGETDRSAARLIGTSYALTALMICLTSDPGILVSETGARAGLGLFAAGSFGNLYHHYLLATLRSDSPSSRDDAKLGTKKYKAPTGGLFRFVAAPHYLFELVAWVGIALASQQLTSYLNLASMTLYLLARSYNQNLWNKTKFSEDDWPSTRKNLIPFIF